ncbi:MAG TPA: carboxypeptidase regulatory-like domain-containing protein [Isosphaeraceae bacterium]|nr:carboxypeptidase regulatory-like domain-containing protein [Isosphaeraceae bacterium]
MMNVMIAHANAAGARWGAWVVAASLDAAFLLALLSLVWLAIRRRFVPQLGYCLFLLVPLKLLVPVVVTVPSAIAEWTPSALASSWFDRARVPVTIAFQPKVARQIASVQPEMAAPSEPRHESLSLSTPITANAQERAIPHQPRSWVRAESTASALTDRVSDMARLSLPAIAMLAWICVITMLFARLALMQVRFRAAIRRVSLQHELTLPIDMRELCRRAGVDRMVRAMEADSVAAPSVWGITRPTIILPRGIAAVLSVRQLQWVVLHELSHIRRGDLIVVILQRFVAILYFFNPAIWMANRIIDQLREYACDDLAVTFGDCSAIESCEAFIHVLRHARHQCGSLGVSLGIFGLSSKSSYYHRVRRLLEIDKPIHTAPGVWSVCSLMVLAVVSVPHLRSANVPVIESALATEGQEFALDVVGPTGKPIPAAQVELQTDLALTVEQVINGQFVKQESSGILAATNTDGRLVVRLPRTPSHFNVKIISPGYGPFWAGWSSENHIESIPSRLVAQLEPGYSVGGIIIDAAGEPVEGATIVPRVESKKPPGDLRQFIVGTRVTTNAAGRWRFDSVPLSMTELPVIVKHPLFIPARWRLTRGEFGIEGPQQPESKLVLERGLTVIGTVTDEGGQPIAGAMIHTNYVNGISGARSTKTASDGTYILAGFAPSATRIVVTAKGRALDMRDLDITSGMGPVNFQLKAGGTVRIRVLDEQGKQVPNARIFFQRWRGRIRHFEFDHLNHYTDDNGVWVWNEAPLDEFHADICPPDGMRLSAQRLIAREQEYVYRVSAPLVVSGKVVDAETKQPIKTFRVVPGFRSSQSPVYWDGSGSFTASDGQYRIRHRLGYSAHLVRIEADGYRSAFSRDIASNEGTVAIDFELKTGKNIVAKVVTPRNAPAAEANVVLAGAGSHIRMSDGAIDGGLAYCTRAIADETGLFHFPPQDTNFKLVISHPSGYAEFNSSPEWDLTRIIHLEPWAKVEGTFRVGQVPVTNATISINLDSRPHVLGDDGPDVLAQYFTTTGPGGRFVFDRVIPGRGRIGRLLMPSVADGAMSMDSSCRLATNFVGGQTVEIGLNGSGRPVVGKLLPPEGFAESVRWGLVQVRVQPLAAEIRGINPQWTATVDREGNFRIDDMPAGDYALSVSFQRDDAGHLRNYRFRVPPQEGVRAAEPLDLGPLKLTR